jgi:hypothetical protein
MGVSSSDYVSDTLALEGEPSPNADGSSEGLMIWRDNFNLPTLTLTRGLDLSGSFDGAGSVNKNGRMELRTARRGLKSFLRIVWLEP